jgi:hypothetical protein
MNFSSIVTSLDHTRFNFHDYTENLWFGEFGAKKVTAA